MPGSVYIPWRSITRMIGRSRASPAPSYLAMCGTGSLCLQARGDSQRKVPNLFTMVAHSLRALRHLEVGARVPDHRASTSHRAVELD